jgi:hypothetical protein
MYKRSAESLFKKSLIESFVLTNLGFFCGKFDWRYQIREENVGISVMPVSPNFGKGGQG